MALPPVVPPSVVLPSVVLPSVVLPSVVLPSVVLPSVVPPLVLESPVVASGLPNTVPVVLALVLLPPVLLSFSSESDAVSLQATKALHRARIHSVRLVLDIPLSFLWVTLGGGMIGAGRLRFKLDSK
jgi:hypothetical protein